MKTPIALIVCTLIAAGCGGGVDTSLNLVIDGPTVTQPQAQTFPLAAAVSATLQGVHAEQLTANDGSTQYTLDGHAEPGPLADFEGQRVSTMNDSNRIARNGVEVAGSTLTGYFDLMPFRPVGGINHTLGTYDVASEQQSLPPTAVGGQRGPVSKGARYSDVQSTRLVATSELGWSLHSEGPSTAWACMDVAIRWVDPSQPAGAESVCYRIDTAGRVSGMRVGVTLDGKWLDFQ
jgi:hypothetical protein